MLASAPVRAASVIEEWDRREGAACAGAEARDASIRRPRRLLMLDFMNQNCGQAAALRQIDPGDEEAARCRTRSEGTGDLQLHRQHHGRPM